MNPRNIRRHNAILGKFGSVLACIVALGTVQSLRIAGAAPGACPPGEARDKTGSCRPCSSRDIAGQRPECAPPEPVHSCPPGEARNKTGSCRPSR
jgi:hypothetical protein